MLKLRGDKIRSMALLDGLTGIANRRRFDDEIDRSWRYCLREQRPLTVMMIDVDYFKRYNDHYGHQAGDKCLQTIAHALDGVLQRPHDVVARYGGEEFACLLGYSCSEGVETIAERMLRAVSDLRIEHLDSEVWPFVSISIGVATAVPQANSSTEALITAADKALYNAKEAGRNRYCMSSL